jgi:hypothetical protein
VDSLPAPRGSSSVGWSNLTAGLSPAPQPLTWASIAYDSHDGYVLLFGGYLFNATDSMQDGIITGGNVTSQTWKFQNGTWTDLTRTAGVAPAPREGAMMSDDPSDGYVLLFGGTYSVFCSNGANNTTPSHPPGANCSMYPGPYDYAFYPNDTWTFRDGAWSRLHPLVSPPGRALGQMAYDPRDGYVVFFGGLTGQGLDLNLGDTWTFSHGNWTDLTPSLRTAPGARGMGGMAWDASDGCLLLFGGVNYISTSPWTTSLPWNQLLNDTWTFVGGNWTNITASLPLSPAPRWNFQMAEAPTGGVLLFAGSSFEVNLNDTWLFQDGQWRYLSPGLTSEPPALDSGMAAFMPTENETLLFGGQGGDQMRCGPGYCENVQNYTWVFGPAAPTGFRTFSFPTLTITSSPAAPWAPLNLSINVSVRGGHGPYELMLEGGSLATTGIWGEQDNFTGNAGCGIPGPPNAPTIVSNGSNATYGNLSDRNPIGQQMCPGPTWNGSTVTVFVLGIPIEQVVYVLGAVVDAQGTIGVAQAIFPVAEIFHSSVHLAGSNPYTAPASLTFSVRGWGGVPPYRAVENFGDGSTSSTSLVADLSSLVNHTYTAPGTYYPTFTVYDSAGHSQSWSFTVTTVQSASVPTLLASAAIVGMLSIGVGTVSVGRRRDREQSEATGLVQALSEDSHKADPTVLPP